MTNGMLLPEEKEFQRQYRFSSWWVNNRTRLKKIGFGTFIAVDALLLLSAAYGLLDGFVLSEPKERRAVLEMVAYGQPDLHAYTDATAAKDLDPGPVTVIAGGQGKDDFYAAVENPNADWWAEYRYQFTWDGGETPIQSSFVLPGQSQPAPAFSVSVASPPRAPKLILSDIFWHRVDHHVTGDEAAWQEDRTDFLVENVAFSTEQLTDTFGRVTFDVTNRTAYSYYDPAFIILLMRGSTVVGVNKTTLSSLDSGEKQTVVVNWFGTLPSVGNVQVIPVVNPFDLLAYKPLVGETPTDTRTRVFSNKRR